MMFFGKTGRNMGPWINASHVKSCSSRTNISNKVWFASNGDRMPKLRPWEVETPIYPNRAHSFGASSPRVRFLDVWSFPLFLNNK